MKRTSLTTQETDRYAIVTFAAKALSTLSLMGIITLITPHTLARPKPATAVTAGTFSGVESPVVVKPGDQFDPVISGRYVVFTDTSGGNADIWYFDSADGSLHPAVTGPGDQFLSEIAGSRIVYTDANTGNGDIRLFDIITGSNTAITSDPAQQLSPSISGRLAAWEDSRGADRDIWVLDLVTGEARSVTGAGDQNSPAASGNQVVFVDNTLGSIVRVYNADSGTTETVTLHPAVQPNIDGNNVAFILLDGTDPDIGVHDLGTGTEIRLALPGTQLNPHISGDWVSFEDDGLSYPHIGLWNWKTGDLYYPAPSTSQQTLNGISGTRVVYTDNRNGNLDIYAYDFTYLDTIPPSGTVVINGGATFTTSPTVTLTLTCTDNVACTQMQVAVDGRADTEPWQLFAASKMVELTPGNGAKTVAVRFQDAAGNVSAQATASIILDTIPPTGTVSINGGATFTTSPTVTLTLTCTDNVACTEMQIAVDGTADTEPWEPFAASKGVTLTPGDGRKTVAVRFKDRAGNVSLQATAWIIFDTTAPTGTITINGGAPFTASPVVTLTLKCTDNVACSQMQVAVDGTADTEAWELFVASKVVTLTSGDGTKTVAVRFKDGAGNISATALATIVLCTSADVSVSLTQGSNYPVYFPNPVTYTATVTNNGPSCATGVLLNERISMRFGGDAAPVYVSAPSTCDTRNPSEANCYIGVMLKNSTTTVTIVVVPSPLLQGTNVIENVASVTAKQTDPQIRNNSAFLFTTIIGSPLTGGGH